MPTRITILLVALIFLTFNCQAQQSTFNLRVNFGYPNTSYNGVLEIEDGYVCTGFLRAIENPSDTPMIFSKFDKQGNHLFNKIYGGYNDKQLWVKSDNLNKTSNDELIITGTTFNQETLWKQGFIMKLNLSGDTLAMYQFYSPTFDIEDEEPEAFIYIKDLVLDEEDNIYLLVRFSSPETSNDFYVMKLNPNLDLIWEHFFIEDGNNYGDGLFFKDDIIYIKQSSSEFEIIKLNTHGELIEKFGFDDPVRVEDIVIDEKEDILLVQRNVTEVISSWEWYVERGVNKYDQEGNLIWEMLPITHERFDSESEFVDLEPTLDGNYVVAGHDKIQLEVGDSLNGNHNIYGHLVKFSDDGELIWERRHHFVVSPHDIHIINDLKATSDGGYIMVGEAIDGYFGEDWDNEIAQQGWIIKVDECGCLVPGCDPNCDYKYNQIHSEESFLIGPNPVLDQLNIHLMDSEDLENSIFTIYDLQGRMIDQFPAYLSNTTYLYNCSDLESGQYIIELSKEGTHISTKKFVVN